MSSLAADLEAAAQIGADARRRQPLRLVAGAGAGKRLARGAARRAGARDGGGRGGQRARPLAGRGGHRGARRLTSGHGAARRALRRGARGTRRPRRRAEATGRGLRPGRPVWVVSFNDEEGGRFQTGMLGSRAFVGDLDLEDWRARGVAAAMAEAGFDFERLPEARADRGAWAPISSFTSSRARCSRPRGSRWAS